MQTLRTVKHKSFSFRLEPIDGGHGSHNHEIVEVQLDMSGDETIAREVLTNSINIVMTDYNWVLIEARTILKYPPGNLRTKKQEELVSVDDLVTS